MSLRKITTLLLLAAFALTSVPVQAASLSDEGQTPPSTIVDAGTPANGANRDVVPVNITVDATGNEHVYATYTSAAANTFNVADNGQLSVTGVASLVGDLRVMILTPPTGTQFVGLEGYNGTVTSGTLTGGATDEANAFVNVEPLAASQMPEPGDAVSESAILAKVLTENGGTSFFGGQSIPKGSIVIFGITNQTTSAFGPSIDADIKLENIGLAVDAGTTLPSSLDVTYVEPSSSSFDEFINLADAATLEIATPTTDANGQIAVFLDPSEADDQSNAVLADLLASGSSTVNVNTNNTTSTANGLTTIYVDTDALLIQAGETPTSTMGTPVYYDTPFNTSSFLSSVVNGNNTTQLNAALTSSASFPNTANALITVTYSLVPLTGNGSTDATLTLDAASVSLMDQGTNNGFLGAETVDPTDNGGTITDANFGVAVLYNGTSSTGSLPVIDFDFFDDTVTDVTANSDALGFDFTAVPDPIARTTAATTPFTNNGGNLATGVFPGVTIGQADAITTTPGVVDNANPLTNNVNATGFAGATVGEQLWVPDEVTARLVSTGGNAVFVFAGNEAAATLGNTTTKVGPTNLATVDYNMGASLQSNAADDDVQNNAIMVAGLSSNTVQIMPLVNKVDGVRDIIKVRPEITITLGTNSKAQGVKLIATVTGNNIAGSKEITVARVNAAGSTDVDLSLQALPAAGDLSGLLVENGDDASDSRAAIVLSGINTTNTSVDSLVDTANGLVLDDTLPSFFCGGTAGDATNGPNSVPQQPFARAILVQEDTANAFDDALVGGGNDVIRFTLPVGMDLARTSATDSSNDVTVVSSDAGSAGTFSASPAVTDYQTVAEQAGGQAFVDVSYSALVSGTDADTVRKAVALIFGELSLVIPEGQTDFGVTVSLVLDDGASTTAGDTTLDTIGTVDIIDSCATQFTISYCDDALANFGQASGPIESDIIANGSELTSFDPPTSTIRLINTETTAFPIPDICVAENVPDALFAGPSATTPNIFGGGETISLAISDNDDDTIGADNVGFAGAGNLDQSDDSLSMGAPALAGGLLNSTFGVGTGTDDFLESTTLRFTGITLGKTNSNFQPAVQDFTVFTNDGGDHIGTTLPVEFETRGDNGTALTTVANGGLADALANQFFNGDATFDNTSADFDNDGGDFTNGDFLRTAFANTNSPILDNAVDTIADSSTVYDQLDDATKLSIAVDSIDAVTNGLAAYTRITVFTSASELEPGSMILVTSPTDNVRVPVNDDGNFIAQLRGSQGDTLVIQQTPTSDQTSADQTVVVEAQDQNLEPTLLSAVSQNFTTVGTITQQGTAPVLFKLTTVGRENGEVFVPTASQLRIGSTGTVYAVPGTDDMFLAIVDFRKTDGTVISTVGVTGNPSVSLSGMDVDFPTFNKRTRPILKKVLTRTKKNGDTRVVYKGRRLRNAGVGYIITTDGTAREVTFRKRTRNDRSKNRVVSEGTDAVDADALFGVYHVPGRGITTLDLN